MFACDSYDAHIRSYMALGAHSQSNIVLLASTAQHPARGVHFFGKILPCSNQTYRYRRPGSHCFCIYVPLSLMKVSISFFLHTFPCLMNRPPKASSSKGKKKATPVPIEPAPIALVTDPEREAVRLAMRPVAQGLRHCLCAF